MTDQPTVVVSGYGSVSGTPDQCLLLVSFTTMADDVAEALERCGEAASRGIAAVREAGVAQRDVQTLDLSVQDYFDPGERRVTARIGSCQWGVTVRSLGAVSGVVRALVEAAGDAVQIMGLHLTVSNREPLEREARVLAVRNAEAKASVLAQAGGLQLGAIVTMEDGELPSGRRPMPARATSASTAASLPIEPGQAAVTASVVVTYALEAAGDGTVDPVQ